jgi:ubiquinone/menaquinone biosynthesis C-methylase UbiE
MSDGFDRIARIYRTLEYLTLGRMLERTRLYHLPHLRTAKRALVLGDGDGRFLAALLRANPLLEAQAIDRSAEMLRLLRERCSQYAGRLRTVQADALAWTPETGETYDLVVTHFFLDCLKQSDVDQIVSRLAPHLSSDALWVVSEFRAPEGALHWPARVMIRGLYFAFEVLAGLKTNRLPNYATAFQLAGLRRVKQRELLGGILITEMWQRGDR